MMPQWEGVPIMLNVKVKKIKKLYAHKQSYFHIEIKDKTPILRFFLFMPGIIIVILPHFLIKPLEMKNVKIMTPD